MKKSGFLLLLYTLFVCVGIIGVYFSRQSVIVSSFDEMVHSIWVFVLIVSTLLSVLFFHVFWKFRQFQELPLFGKILIHGFSVVLIGMGLVGGAVLLNTQLSDKSTVILKGELIGSYERGPKNDYKYSYSYSRYYIDFKEEKSGEVYHWQVNQKTYERVLLKHSDVKLNRVMIESLKKVNMFDKVNPKVLHDEIEVNIGFLGYWY